jgi:integrase
VFVSGPGADLQAGSGEGAAGYRPAVLQTLWQAVPAGMRLAYFDIDTVPQEYRGGLGQRPGRGAGVDLSMLATPIRQELAWCVFRIIEQGGKVDVTHMRMLARRLDEAIRRLGPRAPDSLTGLSTRDWCQHSALAVQHRTGTLPAPGTAKDFREQLRRCHRLLSAAYDTRPWWAREVWDPNLDPRIPQRPHEPRGRQAVHFTRIGTGWLRHGLQWYCRVALETGALSWGTVQLRVDTTAVFDAFLGDRGVPGPWLADDGAQVRLLMLDYLAHLRARRVERPGRGQGQPLSRSRISALLTSVEQFYAFMHDHRDTAAAALAEPGWLRLGPHHAVFFRRGEKPGRSRRTPERQVIDIDAFTQIMAGVGVLGAPSTEDGLGDEQAMRILMLLARTGRRINEICMLDRDPLLALDTPATSTPTDPGAFVARLHYQQTKIDGGPDTILIDQEIVTIIRTQQEWADRHLAEQASTTRAPKYLFLAARKNRNADRPYSCGRLRDLLGELARRLDVRDSVGTLVDFQRTHRFRHTKATGLLNAGVPLHVVQRYLGHLSPTMTMIYAQTLASTHEREFLRYRKLTADARELDVAPHDLYDMLQLNRHTDRILPNGFCLLPPRQSCSKGNACLTCDKFATDVTFLPELSTQRTRTTQLIEERRAAFTARTGQQMNVDNVWLAGRQAEQDALGRIITALQRTQPDQPPGTAVRGAGAAARTEALATDRGEN